MTISSLITRARTRTARPRAAGLAAGIALISLGAAACGSSGTSSAGSSASPASPAASPPASAPASSSVSAAFMTATSSASFSGTVAALKHSVASSGMMVLGTVDQARALSMTGLSLPGAETFFVGNPATGKMFFQADPAAGAVLPVRMYVWQNQAGQAEVGYFDPGSLIAGISPNFASSGKKLSMMAAQIAKGATGSAPAASGTAGTRFVTAVSGKPFTATVAALNHSVAGSGMMVLGSLNQAKALSMTGLSLPGAETLLVGNPATGKMFFQADPAAGAVVPVSMYVWQNGSGKAEIGYFDPGTLFSAISPKLAAGGAKLSMMAAQIAKAAS